jgi:hypothetical protein
VLTPASVGSSLEHSARIVSPRYWQSVYILMFTSCFDASGKTPSTDARGSNRSTAKQAPDSPALAVVGFASQAGMWTEFDAKWSSILNRYHVEYFHAGDFAYSRKQFKTGWDHKQDQQKRMDFQYELIEVIQECGLRKFGSVLWISDQHKARATMNLSVDDTASPYVMCARTAVEDFIGFALGEGQRDNIEYIFERGDEESKLRKHFRKHGFHDPSFKWKHPVTPKGVTQQPFIGLQAAGWIVWEYYMSFCRSFAEFFKHDVKGRWALQIFDDHRRVPGEVKILYKSAPLVDFMRQYQASFVDLNESIVEATKRLEAAKREGMK